MKRTSIILILLAFVLTTFAQNQNREKRSVSNFTKISFRTGGKLYLKQGSTNSVELEGDKEVLEKVETDVEGGRLVISYKDERSSWFNWRSSWEDKKFVAYVTIKEIDGIYVSGSGDLVAQTKLTGGNMDLKVSGSGNLEAEIEAADVDANVSGSGDLYFKGKARSIDGGISGSGKINFDGMVAGDLDTADGIDDWQSRRVTVELFP